MKKIFILLFLSLSLYSCSQSTVDNNEEISTILKAYPYQEYVYNYNNSTYTVTLNQLVYGEDQLPYRNIGEFKVQYVDNKIYFKDISFLYLCEFKDEVVDDKIKLSLVKKSMDYIVGTFAGYNMEITMKPNANFVNF